MGPMSCGYRWAAYADPGNVRISTKICWSCCTKKFFEKIYQHCQSDSEHQKVLSIFGQCVFGGFWVYYLYHCWNHSEHHLCQAGFPNPLGEASELVTGHYVGYKGTGALSARMEFLDNVSNNKWFSWINNCNSRLLVAVVTLLDFNFWMKNWVSHQQNKQLHLQRMKKRKVLQWELCWKKWVSAKGTNLF